MREQNPSPRSERSRGQLVLGVIAAIEAVAIVLLVMMRTSDAERAPAAHTPLDLATTSTPAFSSADREREREPDLPTSALAAGAPKPDTAPQPLGSASTDTGDVGIVLCGTVTVDDGGPLRHCSVEIFQEKADSAFVNVDRDTYAIAGLEPGLYSVSCSAEGCLSRPVQVGLDDSRPVERLDLFLERVPAIPVRIRTPDGRPLLPLFEQAELPGRLLPIVTLQALAHDLGDEAQPAQSWTELSRLEDEEEGKAELKAGDWDGVLKVQVRLPVYVSLVWDRRVLATQSVSTASAGVSFTVALDTLLRELSTVRVRVVDSDSAAPVDGVLAQLESMYLRGDATGVFVFDKVPPGPHVLHIHPPGAWFGISDSLAMVGANDATHADANISLETKAGEQLDLGDLRLQRTVLVRGRVSDAGGRPLAVDVIATRADADGDSKSRSRRLVVSPNGNDGTFSVHVVPGRWSFATSNDSQAPGAMVLDIRNDIEGVNLIGVGLQTK